MFKALFIKVLSENQATAKPETQTGRSIKRKLRNVGEVKP
jgi:hypothetical protein